nr:unnamed protein product [Callosobruchus chinensis]
MADRGSSKDSPPHSRLFIIHPKTFTADDFHRYFDEFGTIEDLYVVREKGGDPKGMYVFPVFIYFLCKSSVSPYP